MTLQVSTQAPPVTDKEKHAINSCRVAWDLEMNGDYPGAWQALADLCPSLGVRPDLDGLTPATSAELLLRAGSLCGWLGSANQLERSQEYAKDLISESRRIFEDIGLVEKIADASNVLAVCYWREGAYDEARATLRHALTLVSEQTSEIKLRTLLNLAVVERSSLRWKDALQVNRQAAQAFKECTNHSLLGKFHNEYATVLKNVGLAESREDYIDQALMEYAAASFHLEQVGNRHFQAVAENNQALIFSSLGRFAEAHNHLDRARSLFLSVNDRGRVAQVDESRARVLLAEGRTRDAERIVRGSVRTLTRGDEHSLLSEALTTHGIALARLDRREDARTTFKRAVDLAERCGDPETAGIAALTMVEELEHYLGIEARQFYVRAESLLKKSQDRGVQQRLGACARRLLEKESQGPRLFGTGSATSELAELLELSADDSHKKYSLEERVLQYEGHIIKRALEASGGSVTKAARLLGITHQGLAFILNGRHKHLLAVRTPVKPRRRSIIRYHK
jgi:tetratricopeptide (TPR) repeat protein